MKAFPCESSERVGGATSRWQDAQEGMDLRDYFAVRAPAPTKEVLDFESERDRQANPHGDYYKPPRRSILEIEWDLRYRWADAGIAAREKKAQ